VSERLAKDDREGVGLEIIAGLTLLAFEVEARFNFLGAKLISNWEERKPAILKVKRVCKRLGVAPDFSVRPYRSVEKLKDFRDTLAHGKPEEKVFDEEVVATAEDLATMGILRADWEAYIDHGFFQESLWRRRANLEGSAGEIRTHCTRHGDARQQPNELHPADRG